MVYWSLVCAIVISVQAALAVVRRPPSGFNMTWIHNDIVLSAKQIQMRKYNGMREVAVKERGNNRWDNNIVPYVLSNKYTVTEKRIIEDSLRMIEEVTCFRFPKRTDERNYLDIDKRDGCYSFVGKIGGRQVLSLSAGCVYNFIVIHEVMHVLGLEHEHQRPDRNNYLKIQYGNVEPDKISNFALISDEDVDYKEHPYDYRSIMHYDGTAFGKTNPRNGAKMVTMIPLQEGIELHDNYELTDLDIRKLNSLGKCPSAHGTAVCRDVGSDCVKFKTDGLCENEVYRSLLMNRCAKSCGFCGGSVQRAPTDECRDKFTECPTYAKNGFCSSTYYDISLCAKSCSRC